MTIGATIGPICPGVLDGCQFGLLVVLVRLAAAAAGTVGSAAASAGVESCITSDMLLLLEPLSVTAELVPLLPWLLLMLALLVVLGC